MSDPDFSTLSNVSPALTNDKLNKGLTDWFDEEMKFTHWEYVSETGKGDSYLSECIRIRIFGTNENGNTKHVQVILKNIPKSIARQLTFRSADFFKNEIIFYEQVLPELLKFQSKKNLSEPFNNYAKIFLAYCDGTNDFICLEDASLENFGSAVRQEGLDLEHCKLTLKALAQFHALSFAMKDQQPNEFKELSSILFETYYSPHLWSWYERFWKRICGIAINAVETEYPNSIYVDKIKEFAVPERYKEMIRAVTTTENGVISHGDSWTNNFLYKYVNNSVVDIKIIDFQLSRCASPVLDTSFVFCGCTTQELRDKHYEELLKYYYDVLSKQICELGSDANKIYSWETYLRDVKKFSFFGLAFSFESTPMIVLAPEDAVSMDMEGEEKINIDDVWAIGNFKTKEGRLREANNVVHWVNYGYI